MGMVYGYQNKWDHHNDYIWIIVGPMATVLVVRTKVLLIKSCGGALLMQQNLRLVTDHCFWTGLSVSEGRYVA